VEIIIKATGKLENGLKTDNSIDEKMKMAKRHHRKAFKVNGDKNSPEMKLDRNIQFKAAAAKHQRYREGQVYFGIRSMNNITLHQQSE